jgi:hypothetical protein
LLLLLSCESDSAEELAEDMCCLCV